MTSRCETKPLVLFIFIVHGLGAVSLAKAKAFERAARRISQRGYTAILISHALLTAPYGDLFYSPPALLVLCVKDRKRALMSANDVKTFNLLKTELH